MEEAHLADGEPRVLFAKVLLLAGRVQDLVDAVDAGEDEEVDHVDVDQIAQLRVDAGVLDLADRVARHRVLQQRLELVAHLCGRQTTFHRYQLFLLGPQFKV